jgi:hypothetical protein
MVGIEELVRELHWLRRVARLAPCPTCLPVASLSPPPHPPPPPLVRSSPGFRCLWSSHGEGVSE